MVLYFGTEFIIINELIHVIGCLHMLEINTKLCGHNDFCIDVLSSDIGLMCLEILMWEKKNVGYNV